MPSPLESNMLQKLVYPLRVSCPEYNNHKAIASVHNLQYMGKIYNETATEEGDFHETQ